MSKRTLKKIKNGVKNPKVKKMPFLQNQDVNIFYHVVGQGSPLLMIHGGLLNSEIFYEFGYIDSLKDKYQIILIDLRGFGKSDKPHQAEKFSLKLMVDDVIAVLNKLKVNKCHAYGHSLGGWIVNGLAIYYPERLQSLILCDGMPGKDDGKSIKGLSSNLEENISKMDILPIIKTYFLQNDPEALKAFGTWIDEETPATKDMIYSMIEKSSLPTLILMSNLKNESEVYKLFIKLKEKNPNAKLVQLTELSHLELFTNSEKVLPKIKDFLLRNQKESMIH